jgi:hypothetical protein
MIRWLHMGIYGRFFTTSRCLNYPTKVRKNVNDSYSRLLISWLCLLLSLVLKKALQQKVMLRGL